MNPSQAQEDKFRKLHAQSLVAELSADDAVLLAELCRNHPRLMKEFAEVSELDRLLPLVTRDPGGERFDKELSQRLQSDSKGRPFVSGVIRRLKKDQPHQKAMRHWLIGAVLGAAVIGLSLFSLFFPRPAAALVRVEGAVWAYPPPSTKLKANQRLTLQQGVAEIRFNKDTEILLEGPAELLILGNAGARLNYGRAVAKVGEQGHGFYLDGPAGRVVDRGTAFGVESHVDGRMDVQVFEGEVEVTSRGESRAQSLYADERMQLHRGQVTKGAGRSGLHPFITALPPKFEGPLKFLHWRFDEGKGTDVQSEGTLAGLDAQPARFRHFNKGAAAPVWIPGVFGSAIAFDGKDGAIETPFRGVSGNSPRTIAFWLKVPRDFIPEEGYGVLSWGSLLEKGAAWQIAVNPLETDANIGRLRVGIGGSQVVGTTDLRDGKWHHCAVVLYPESYARDVTQTLMFIDGQLETSTGRSVMTVPVHTDTSPEARAVWMGRSLGHGRTDRDSYGSGFFRGELDEVYIFDAALGTEDILKLMKENAPPAEQHLQAAVGR